MSFVDALRHRLHVLRTGEDYADEQAREMQLHLELAALNQPDRGSDKPGAERAARHAFGNVTLYREAARETSLLSLFDRGRQDFGYAWRSLRKAPGFATAVVITLAVGVGLNAAVFTLSDRVFVRPPEAVAAPRELRRLYVVPNRRNASERYVLPVYPFKVARTMASVIGEQRVAIIRVQDSARLEDPTELIVDRGYVSADFFSALGVRLQLGREFTAEEARPDHETPPLVVISDDLWRRAFRGDPSVVGRKARIDGETYVVVGVLARGFYGDNLNRIDLWSPLANLHRDFAGVPWYRSLRDFPMLTAVVRVPAGTTLSRYEEAIAARLHDEGIDQGAYGASVHVIDGPIVEARGPAKQMPDVWISLSIAAVALIVLLIACANAANLMLLRAAQRGREIAIRRALGVSRARLIEQFLVEALLLAVIGAIVALAVAYSAGTLLRHLLFRWIHWPGAMIDLRAIAFLLTVAVFAAVFAGVAPAAATNPDVATLLRGRRDGRSHSRRVRSSLVIVQTALSVVLLVGAILFVRSLHNVQAIGVGYDTRKVLFAGALALSRDESPESVRDFAERLERIAISMRSFRGVRSTAVASNPPFIAAPGTTLFRPGSDSPLMGSLLEERFPPLTATAVTQDYFATVGIVVVAGRTFTDREVATASPVMVVSRRMAHAVWPGQSAIGQCLIVGVKTNVCATVIGVVEDVHNRKILEPPAAQLYVPYGVLTGKLQPSIAVRAAPHSVDRVARELQSRLTAAFPDRRRLHVSTLSQILEPELHPWLVGAQLLTAMGVLALIVAALGIYSVTSYTMRHRTREIGIRLAFGARTNDIFRLALRSGLGTLTIGATVGVAVAVALSRYVEPLLYGIEPTDVKTLVGAALGLVAVGVVAGVVPAWRASRVDPVRTLAAE